jgi:hypothetical protein
MRIGNKDFYLQRYYRGPTHEVATLGMQPGGHGVLTRVRFVLFVPEEELSSVEV